MLLCCWSFGLVGFWINYGVPWHIKPGHVQWLISFAVQLIPGGLFALGLPFFIKESPRWLITRDRRDEAIKNLCYIRRLSPEDAYIINEMNEIDVQVEHDRTAVGTGFWAPFRQSIGVTGTNTSLLTTGVFGVIKTVLALVWCFIVIDRFGRRGILLVGSVGDALSSDSSTSKIQEHFPSNQGHAPYESHQPLLHQHLPHQPLLAAYPTLPQQAFPVTDNAPGPQKGRRMECFPTFPGRRAHWEKRISKLRPLAMRGPEPVTDNAGREAKGVDADEQLAANEGRLPHTGNDQSEAPEPDPPQEPLPIQFLENYPLYQHHPQHPFHNPSYQHDQPHVPYNHYPMQGLVPAQGDAWSVRWPSQPTLSSLLTYLGGGHLQQPYNEYTQPNHPTHPRSPSNNYYDNSLLAMPQQQQQESYPMWNQYPAAEGSYPPTQQPPYWSLSHSHRRIPLSLRQAANYGMTHTAFAG
ncbi:hypothetical protein JCM5296_004760 [Sporobolomyces johnsonii]